MFPGSDESFVHQRAKQQSIGMGFRLQQAALIRWPASKMDRLKQKGKRTGQKNKEACDYLFNMGYKEISI